MRFVRDNGLSIVFLAIFLLTLVGQAIAGHGSFNHDQLLHHGATISFGRYLTTSEFAADVAENWQSEYLQFTLYILGTVWLLQRGSPESKPLDKAGLESDEDQKVGEHADARSPRWARVGGVRTALYSNSLLVVMTTIWLGSWLAQSIAGASGYNANQLDHQAATVSWLQLPGQQRLLGPHAAELAVRVPRRRLDGDPLGLPAPARLAGVQARRRPPRRHGRRGVEA